MEVFNKLLKIIPESLLQVGGTVIAVIVAAILLEVIFHLFLGKALKWKHSVPIMLLVPAIVGLFFLLIVPIGYEAWVAFTNMSAKVTATQNYFTNPDFGIQYLFKNLSDVFTQPILRKEFFFPIFLRTILWTAIQVTFHVGGGLALALLLNREIKLKGLYRTLLVIPWAVPNVVAVLAWQGEFNYQYGMFNNLLRSFGMVPIQWFADWFWNLVAMNLVNIWLGIPFMMVILLGGLQSIPRDFYEAAEIDGANSWQQFKNVTLPMLQPVMSPAIVLGVIWTFNNFNIPFFINQNQNETSEILVTALFKTAFQSPFRYGFAATFAFVIFAILLVISIIQFRVSGQSKELSAPKKSKKIVRAKTAAGEA